MTKEEAYQAGRQSHDSDPSQLSPSDLSPELAEAWDNGWHDRFHEVFEKEFPPRDNGE